MGVPRTFLLLIFSLHAWPVAAQSPEAIGAILLTRGTVTAEDTAGVTRTLQRGSDLHVGDRLTVGDGGFAQVRMIDNAIIAFRENTEFTFHEYSYDGEGGMQDRVRMELHRGGLRTIDGLIGDGADDAYLLVTPGMDVVPDGTTYECAVANGKTSCGVYDGGILVSNVTGSMKLGLGGNGDFAEAESRLGAIVLLFNVPPVLGGIVIQQNPNVTTQPQPAPNTVTPLSSTVTFPVPAPIRVVPYKKPTP